jgi:membrane protease YdiL (CAAX protease family)
MKSILNQIEFDKKELSTYIILLSAPVLLTLYWYYGNAESFGVYFPRLKSDQYFNFYSYIWQFFSFFILTFMIPAIFIKIYLKRLVVPIIYLASQMPDIRQEYPLSKLLHSHHELVLWYEFTRIFVYYVAWEFFFRGFLLFGLRKQFGSMNAILIQTISSCLIHLGKPEGEILGSIILGIIFGAIAIRTRSFLYVFILHSTIGVLTDIFILFL